MTNRAIVLAAGMGSRLVARDEAPKPLKPIAGVPLIVRILRTLQAEGVEEAVVVIGWRGEQISAALRKERSLDLRLRFVENAAFEKKNGVSVLAASRWIDRDCLLSMADHLYSPEVVERLRGFDMPRGGCALAVDRAVDRCFDIDDATKVRLAGRRIVAIGKELQEYDALDTGVFRVGPALVEQLRAVYDAQGDCSLSDGIGALARQGRMYACDLDGAPWIDVDTPAAAVEAEAMLMALGESFAADRPSGVYLERGAARRVGARGARAAAKAPPV
jgi:choline kinase